MSLAPSWTSGVVSDCEVLSMDRTDYYGGLSREHSLCLSLMVIKQVVHCLESSPVKEVCTLSHTQRQTDNDYTDLLLERGLRMCCLVQSSLLCVRMVFH